MFIDRILDNDCYSMDVNENLSGFSNNTKRGYIDHMW